jgi:phosphoglycolate phosphatase
MANARRVLIFDLDGTLIDSAPDLARAVNALLAEQGRPPLPFATVRRLIGGGVPVLVRRAFAAVGPPIDPAALPQLIARYEELYLATEAAETSVYPGVPETLEKLRADADRMIVCTNKFQVPTLKLLEQFDLIRFFDAIAGGDVVPARKPDPAHLLAGLAMVDAAPREAVMIGDGINDVKAAHGAGIPVIVLPSGYGEVVGTDLGGDILLGTFAEIPDALREYGSWARGYEPGKTA